MKMKVVDQHTVLWDLDFSVRTREKSKPSILARQTEMLPRRIAARKSPDAS
jgi:hypothetical protein